MQIDDTNGPPPRDRRPTLLDLVVADPRAFGGRRTALPEGGRISVDGDGDAPVVLLEWGRATVTMPTPQGIDVFLTDLEAGDIIGEGASLDVDGGAVTVRADEDASAWFLDQARFRQRAADCPDFALAALDAMGRRLGRVSQRLAEASTFSTRERIHAELLRLAGADVGRAPRPVRMMTHEALATRAGTQREAITKELSRLRRLGIVAVSGRTLTVAAPDRLGRRRGA
ncbi:Crp/Fnr family transcriptional regulator [Lichenibacterium dinghuense]|uniref:Crp/Fnr family transcriptional regulator n=1 Tax=Lichenibacterium dinghuense TaxID=2895977 RepID=UPI001F473CBC|nr:Crp/Fnr family transcriptional regulator [Lichenibacterium sp. 6Y81]